MFVAEPTVTRTRGTRRPRLGVVKFSSCDGCQLTLLDLEDELLAIAERFEIVRLRSQTPLLVTIGACATAGGIQALRNWADHDAYRAAVYAQPEFVESLATATPISDHVAVDAELRGCPIDPGQLLELLGALIVGRRPQLPDDSVCVACKRRGTVCIAVARGVPCLGPVTRAGCGALCPAYDRGCYGCFGPRDNANAIGLARHLLSDGGPSGAGHPAPEVGRLFAGFTAWAEPFRGVVTGLGGTRTRTAPAAMAEPSPATPSGGADPRPEGPPPAGREPSEGTTDA